MTPEISIIVPVYNVEKYLRRFVNSILAQTFKNFECILTDDGSPDNRPSICDEYAGRNKRISIKDIVFLWKNYSYITTMPAHKGFLSFIIILLNRKPFPAADQAVCVEKIFEKPKTPVNLSAGK